MRFSVRHETVYIYDVPVRLGPHLVRLAPRLDAVSSSSQRLVVTPTPLSQVERLDAFGNRIVELRFEGESHDLRIESLLELDTIPAPALPAWLPPLPWRAEPGDALGAYRAASPASPAVRAFAESLVREAGDGPVAFLDHLARALYDRFERIIRPTGEARSGEETLALGRGACRDLTQLFIEVARGFGLACRFVSGYQSRSAMPDSPRQLHAWPEVHLPGVGFRAWDPTHGTRVTDGHVPLCAAPAQAETMPVEGGYTFQGPTATSTLRFSVSIETR